MTTTTTPPHSVGVDQPPTTASSGALSTPRRYRIMSLIALGTIAVFGFVSAFAAYSAITSADRIVDNSAPVVIAVQDVRASLAEANSAATAAFLSGAEEDPAQRRLYEQAINRASSQIEETARLIGDNEQAHDSLKSLTTNLTRYSGFVEASRLANREGLDSAGDLLSQALTLANNDMRRELEVVGTGAQNQLEDDNEAPTLMLGFTLIASLAAIFVLFVLQLLLSRRSRRLLNLPLLAATTALLATALWLLVGVSNNGVEYDAATNGGADALQLVSQIQATAYDFNTQQSLSLIDGTNFDETAQDVAAAALEDGERSLFMVLQLGADSNREQAAARQMITRWDRYRAQSAEVARLTEAGDLEGAQRVAEGPASTAFVGFNTAVESVSLDNRDQFTSGVGEARNSYDWVQYGMILLPLLAALAAMWGFQVRINEYR